MFLLVLFAIDFLPSESVCFFYKVSLKHVPLYTLCPMVEVQHAPRSRSNMPDGWSNWFSSSLYELCWTSLW